MENMAILWFTVPEHDKFQNIVEIPFLVSSILVMQTLASIRIIYRIYQNNKIDKRQTKLLFGNEDGPRWMECCGEVTKPHCVLMGIIEEL